MISVWFRVKFDSPNSARTLSSASLDIGPSGENDTLHALERFFIFGILHFNVFLKRYQLSNFFTSTSIHNQKTKIQLNRSADVLFKHAYPCTCRNNKSTFHEISQDSLLKEKIMNKKGTYGKFNRLIDM